MKHHGLIITGASFTYPIGKGFVPEHAVYDVGSWEEMPVRGTGAHRIATHLRNTGKWDIEVVDYLEAWDDEELFQFFETRITKNTKWIGFSVFFTYSIHWAQPIVVKQNRLILHIKEKYPWIKIVVGASKLANVIRHEQVDYFCIGNGELGIVALCDYFTGDAPHPKVKVKVNPFNHIDLEGRQYVIIDCFNDYPAFPHKNPHTSYEERDFIRSNEVLTMELSRGCIFKCTFCDFSPLGVKGDHSRHAENFEEELKENYEKWGVTHYCLSDETANASSEYISKFANIVRKLPFQPQFHGFIRGDLLIRRAKQDWDNMIDMGFTSQSMGIETFNHASGKSINKGFSPLQMQEGLLASAEYFKKNRKTGNHYNQTLTMIAGLPHETFETLDRGGEWLNKYWHNQVNILPLHISQHITDGIDAVSDIDKDPSKYGYTWRDSSALDRVIEDYYYQNWEVMRVLKPNYGLRDMVDDYPNIKLEIREESKERGEETNSRIWVHPSGDYDQIDMLEWTTLFQSDRIIKLGRPESLNGWHMGWYKQLGYDLRETYEKKLPDITKKDVDKYYGFLERYKKNKLNWYK